MNKKRPYIEPETTAEQWLGRECWMMAGISDAKDPNGAPKRRTDVF